MPCERWQRLRNREWPARDTIRFMRCTPGMGVNLWGESPLYENQGCPCLYEWMLPEVQAEGKGVSARMGPKEAGAHTCGPTNRNRIVRLSLRASWHDTTKPTGSGDRVNAAVVHGRFTFLSGEICPSCVR